MLNLKMPILESERLILRPIRLEDAEDMYAYASDDDVLKYLWWEKHTSVDQSRESIRERFLKRPETGIPEAYAIVVKADGHMIGTIDVHTVRFNDVGVIGYVIHKNYWGQGIVSEALQMIIPVCFHHCGFYRIEINHCADNVGSQKAIERAGFIYEGCFRKRKVERDGHRGDYLNYGLNADDAIVLERYGREAYEKVIGK